MEEKREMERLEGSKLAPPEFFILGAEFGKDEGILVGREDEYVVLTVQLKSEEPWMVKSYSPFIVAQMKRVVRYKKLVARATLSFSGDYPVLIFRGPCF